MMMLRVCSGIVACLMFTGCTTHWVPNERLNEGIHKAPAWPVLPPSSDEITKYPVLGPDEAGEPIVLTPNTNVIVKFRDESQTSPKKLRELTVTPDMIELVTALSPSNRSKGINVDKPERLQFQREDVAAIGKWEMSKTSRLVLGTVAVVTVVTMGAAAYSLRNGIDGSSQ